MSDILDQKEPIRGWLVLFGTSLWVGPFLYLLIFVTSLTTLHQHQLHTDIALVEGAVGTICAIPFLVLFTKRKSSFVKWCIIYKIYAVLLETAFLVANIHSHSPILNNLIGYVLAAIIVLYLLRSKRVKRTFVR